MAAAKKAPIAPKVGLKAKAEKRDGTFVTGEIAGINPGSKGTWIALNTAKKGQTPDITKFPASKVKVMAAAAA